MPAGTVTVTLPVSAPTAGAFGSNGESSTGVSAIGVTCAGTSPLASAVSVPVYPVMTRTGVDPEAPVPVTSAGAAAGTARTAIGLRTSWPSGSRQRSEPNDHSPNAADVRVIVTLKVFDLPALTISSFGDTSTVKPGGAWTVGT